MNPLNAEGKPPNKASLEGEHKVISVLFSDVVNYTTIAEKLDLEVVREIVNNHFKILIESVNNYKGTVDQLLGDGMIAFFGAPLAHEDHAQRACYAALAMQEAIRHYAETIRKEYGIDFKIRIGLNSGPVLVGPIGSDHHTEYIAIGDTVNLASRLEGASRPGGILVSDNIYSLTKDFFEFESIGEIGIKGKENPLAAYRLIRASETERRFDAAVKRGLTRFVGRDNEIEVIEQAFTRARDGSTQIVGIWGEPGIGKSRLLREFRESRKSDDFNYLEGRCLHYGRSMPFKPLVDIAKAYFDIKEGEPEPDTKNRMVEKLGRLDDGLVDYLPFLYEMLSFKINDERYLKMENQYKRSKLFEGITRLLRREASVSPLVVAVEDLHWIDKASEEFLTYLMSWLSDSRILLVLLYRPEYPSPWSNRSNYTEVHLNQLTITTSGELLQSLLPDREPASELKELVLTRTGGNPLFLEEFVRTLMDSGAMRKDGRYYTLDAPASMVGLPDTIQGIIADRIDRLPEGLKNTLQVASAIGRDFNYPVLHDVTRLPEDLKSQLETLQQLEFIMRKSISPEMECVFKHALIQEVAYNSMLQKRRREIHESIGRTIERLYPSRLEEFTEVLAYHYQHSNSLNNAVEYLRKSGQRALNRFATEEANGYYQQGFDIVSNNADATREESLVLLDIILEWAEVHYYQGRFRALFELLRRHESLADSVGDKYHHAMLLGWLGMTLHIMGRSRESYQYLRRALVLAEQSGEPKAIAYVCAWLPWTCLAYGVTGEGMAYGKRAIEASYHAKGNDYPYIKALGGMGFLAGYTGQIQKARECGWRLLEFGKKRGNVRSLTLGHWILGMCCGNNGEVEASLEECRLGIELNPDPFYLDMLIFSLGNICVSSGRFQEAEAALSQLRAHSQECGLEGIEWAAVSMLGLVYMAQGRMSEGLGMITGLNSILVANEVKMDHAFNEFCRGMAYSRLACPPAPVKLSLLIKNLGFLLRHAPFATRKAVFHYNQAIRICQDCGFKVWLGMTLVELGRLYQRKGKKEPARENLSAAVKLCRESGDAGSAAQAEALLRALDEKESR
jgi:class 3 adenylate cyclase